MSGTFPAASSRSGSRAEAAVRRELLEETGLELDSAELMRIDIEPYGDRFVFSVTFRVTASGEPVAADDVDELRWFDASELPAEMAFPGQDSVLRDWMRTPIGPNSLERVTSAGRQVPERWAERLMRASGPAPMIGTWTTAARFT